MPNKPTTPEKTGIWESYVSGLRFMPLKEYLWNSARNFGLDITFTGEDKGLLRKTVWFKITGNLEKLKRLQAEIIKDFNE